MISKLKWFWNELYKLVAAWKIQKMQPVNIGETCPKIGFLDIQNWAIIIPQRWGPDGLGMPGPLTRIMEARRLAMVVSNWETRNVCYQRRCKPRLVRGEWRQVFEQNQG